LEKVNLRLQIYSNDDIIVGTHVASLDATVRRSFYASLVGPRSFIPENDSSTGEGLLFIIGEGETRTRSQCHADGTASEDHLAELRRTLSFLLVWNCVSFGDLRNELTQHKYD
jgi:hypothetical protein